MDDVAPATTSPPPTVVIATTATTKFLTLFTIPPWRARLRCWTTLNHLALSGCVAYQIEGRLDEVDG